MNGPDTSCGLAAGLDKPVGASVHFSDVSKQYGELTALEATSLTIGAGEFFAIIGPSGSGKSTLLGITAGFISPSTGSIKVKGMDIVGVPPYKRNIGMVFQNYALFPHMTVAENIAFPLRMRGLSKFEIGQKVRQLLDMVRLVGVGDRRPSQLSGGQQQRVALARASAYSPHLLLMDEPLGALDKNLREEMQSEIKRFQSRIGATVIYVTHDQQEAASMADRIAIMQGGRVEQVATPRLLYERPKSAFVANFLGEATLLPMGAVLGREGGGLVVALSGNRVFRVVDDGDGEGATAICLRPENIVLGGTSADVENQLVGVITEATFLAGTVRYRVQVEDFATDFVVRVPSHLGVSVLPVGAKTSIGWKACDAVLVS
jgi:putative spermidine/putrescine transport system ATP-binding protein